jgi:hypothetical protein
MTKYDDKLLIRDAFSWHFGRVTTRPRQILDASESVESTVHGILGIEMRMSLEMEAFTGRFGISKF